MLHNRRSEPRLDQLTGVQFESSGCIWDGLLHDLGPKGCRAASVKHLAPQERVNLTVEIEAEPLQVVAQVVWCSQIRGSDLYQTGLAFQEFLQPDGAERLRLFLETERGRREYLCGQTFSAEDADHLSNMNAHEARHIASLARLSRYLNRSHELHEVAQAVVEAMLGVMRAERVLVLLTRDRNHPELLASGGGAELSTESYSRSTVARVLERGLPVLSMDVESDAMLQDQESLQAMGTRSILCLPLLGREAPIGVVYMDNSREAGAFGYGDLEVARVLGELATASIERAQLMEMLVQNEKMSALGTLMASLAHELSNPLTAILGVGELLACEGGHDELVEDLQIQTSRCYELVRSLTNWSRSEETEPIPITFDEVLKATLPLVTPELRRSGVRLVKDIDPELPRVLGHVNPLSQVLVNLLNNAIHATREMTRRCIRLWVSSSDAHLYIRVEDNGSGIAPEHLSRVFDPFFSTKPKGQGTGLGLCIVRGIANRYGGRVEARNLPNGGAQFLVELPALCEAAGKDRPSFSVVAGSPAGRSE